MRTRLTRLQRQRQTRADLVEAAVELFAARGVAQSSVEAIAGHAGYSRGAYHSNFDNRDELLDAVADLVINDLSPVLDEILRAPSPSTDRLRGYIRAFAAYCESQPRRTRALVAVVAHRAGLGGPDYDALVSESLTPLVDLFTEGQVAGEMRVFDTAVMAEMVRRTLDWVALRISNGSPAGPLADELSLTLERATCADSVAEQPAEEGPS